MIRNFSPLFASALMAMLPATTFATPGDFDTKIVGGSDAEKGEFPFLVSLQSSGGHFCGGSLIKKDWVLTAAHCVAGGAPAKIVIGLYDRRNTRETEIIRPSSLVVHPKNNGSNMDYDFALIRLSSESKFAPIALNAAEIGGGIEMITAGWGSTKEGGSLPNILQKVTVPSQTDEACAKSYPNQTTPSMICAGFDKGGKDSCQGDSGGPLFMGEGEHRVLVGVVSWGEGCARPNKLGVYAKVSAAIPWIEATAK